MPVLEHNLSAPAADVWTSDEFVARLRAVGERKYHHQHPFHLYMNDGRLNPAQLRGWAANRFYYQRNIPLKDAAIISNCPHRHVRRAWLHRITDHDGIEQGQGRAAGGIEAWIRLAQATGLTEEEVLAERHVVPAVRFAVDAYVALARTCPWQVAVASSLTEMFAPDLMSRRLQAFERHYQWVDPTGLEYFRTRVSRARDDATEALDLTLTHCNTATLQRQAVEALTTKCDILWAQLDGIALSYCPQCLSEPAAVQQEKTA